MVTIVGQIECTDSGRWPVQREFNRRMKIRFQQLGVDIAYPGLARLVTDDIPQGADATVRTARPNDGGGCVGDPAGASRRHRPRAGLLSQQPIVPDIVEIAAQVDVDYACLSLNNRATIKDLLTAENPRQVLSGRRVAQPESPDHHQPSRRLYRTSIVLALQPPAEAIAGARDAPSRSHSSSFDHRRRPERCELRSRWPSSDRPGRRAACLGLRRCRGDFAAASGVLGQDRNDHSGIFGALALWMVAAYAGTSVSSSPKP